MWLGIGPTAREGDGPTTTAWQTREARAAVGAKLRSGNRRGQTRMLVTLLVRFGKTCSRARS
eukprot:COSAG05_NODE_311_length_11636_cov_11.922250_10_plen_62_part_00